MSREVRSKRRPLAAPRAYLLIASLDVPALLEIRIEDRAAGRAPARLGTLENQLFSTNHLMKCYTSTR